MAMSRIQFQHGLSMPDFLKDYGTVVQCEQALEAVRWPSGFCCPRCRYALRYLAAFCYRFNRRFDLRVMHWRLLIAATSSAPHPMRLTRLADVRC